MNYPKDPKEFRESCGYEIDGAWYPRVTKIIDIKSKPSLYRFYAALSSFEEGEKIAQRSADEGTLVHETVQGLMTGKKVDIDPSIKPSVDALFEFLERKHIRIFPEFVEKRIIHRTHRYSGTIDGTAEIDGKVGVLDIKTSQSIYRDYNLQTAAYMGAFAEDFLGPQFETRWILRIDQMKTCKRCGATLRPKGGRDKIKTPPSYMGFISCPEKEHEWGDMRGIIELKEFPYWKSDFEAFLAAKRLWEWEHEYMLKKIGYL